jgi:hypothetical protein
VASEVWLAQTKLANVSGERSLLACPDEARERIKRAKSAGLPRRSSRAFQASEVCWLAQTKLVSVSSERSLASLMPAGWNQIAIWLARIDDLREAA